MKTIVYIVLFGLCFSQEMKGQFTNQEVKAKIEIEENADFISITGFAENLTDTYKSLQYKLSVIKSGDNGNRSNNTQGGRFTLEASQIKSLSKTQINITKSQTIILLLIYDENQRLIGKDRVVLGEKKIGENNQKPYDGIEITGIISDETKTKMGKDFYDTFYSEFSKLKVDSSKMIVVEEEMANSRTTRIRVKVESDIITEFISKPDQDFLTAMAEDAAAKTFNFFKNLERQKKYITQY